MTQPIRPDEVDDKKSNRIPPFVFEVFNEQIVSKWNGTTAIVYQDDVLSALAERGVTRVEAFEKKYLDVEYAYGQEGWKVTYDKPAYNETHKAHFIFKKK